MVTEHRTYLPAMARPALLPLYDPVTRLSGARGAHWQLVAQAAAGPGATVLEVGTGTGNLLLLVKRAVPEATVIGLDPDPAALALARRKAARAGLEVRLDEGFADRLPYPDGSIDRVLSSFMLHHLPPAERLPALRGVRRVLAPGGSLHVLDLDGTGRFGRRAHPHGVGPRGLLDEAGFPDVVEVGRGSSWFGGHSFHRAAG